ncbi:MAG: protein-export chaperone SecB [Mariprofundaceae bacterium]|nr:protein-export chaperone SecB [Mariprofundaceae bacterium]
MSNNDTASAEAPIFSLQRVYVKDISFENPNAPEVFNRVGTPPKIEMNLGLSNRQVNDEHWEVSLKVAATTRDQESNDLLFEIEVEHAAVFFMQNIPAEHIPTLLAVDCPTILFPYTRQIVSQLTVDGGFMPFMLEPVNFRGIYENQLQQQTAEKEGATVQ